MNATAYQAKIPDRSLAETAWMARVSVRFLADRGFADTRWMHYLNHPLQWHFRNFRRGTRSDNL